MKPKLIQFTDRSQIIEFKKQKFSLTPEEIANKINIDIETYKSYDNWVIINGEWYYYKEIYDERKFVNEMLGVKVCEYFDIPSVKYDIGYALNLQHLGITLISKNFRKNDVKYLNQDDVTTSRELITDINDYVEKDRVKEVKLKLLKALIVNFAISNIDYNRYNILFEVKKSKIFDIAPLFDFENSFKRVIDLYQNDLQTFRLEDLKEMMDTYPQIKPYIQKIFDMNLLSLLDDIQEQYHLIIDKEQLKNSYIDYENKLKSRLSLYLK